MHFDLAILGAGAAGMMAAVAAGERLHGTGQRIAIFERNAQPGIKVLVCGGGRCNFTNAGTVQFLIEQFGRNGRFLTPALTHLDNEALRDFFASLGVPSHIEHDGKVYPDSNQARSVVDALVRRMRELDVHIFTGNGSAVTGVRTQDSAPNTQHFQLATSDGRTFTANTIVLAVGGMSYQRMGTLGDGYRIAQSMGHSIITPRPAIVGLLTQEQWFLDIKGLAVRDVEVRIAISGTLPVLATGKPQPSVNDMLFTHFGLSGPAVLNVSEIVAELLEKMPAVALRIDFARHISHEEAHALLRSWQQHHGKRLLKKMFSANTPDVIIHSTSPDMTAPPASNNENQKSKSKFPPPRLALPARLAEKVLALEETSRSNSAPHLRAGRFTASWSESKIAHSPSQGRAVSRKPWSLRAV